MNELSAILDSSVATDAFFYGSVVALVCFGAGVSWLQSIPARRRARWHRAISSAVTR